MTKDEIISYVLNSPENTNPNVLKGMLDQLDSGDDSKIPMTYYEDTIEFYFSVDGAEGNLKMTSYICEDISDNITQILVEVPYNEPYDKGIFWLVTPGEKVHLLPANPFSLPDSALRLIQEKEAWVLAGLDQNFLIIKDSNGVVSADHDPK